MPEPFKRLTSRGVVLSQSNIDTDQIIPGRFLTTTTRAGLGKAAFYDWRYEADGSEKPEAILNRIDPAEHRILRRAEVEAKTGFKRAHIYSLMKEGKFPKALRLGVRAVGWDSEEVEQWIADRLDERA